MSRVLLTKRDIEMMMFCFEERFLTLSQVSEWFCLYNKMASRDSISRIVRRRNQVLLANGLIYKGIIPYSKERYIKLTKKGISYLKSIGLIDDFHRYQEIDLQTFTHSKIITDIRLGCVKAHVLKNWTADRVLKTQANDAFVPDAVVHQSIPITQKTIEIALEIELTQKSQNRLRNIFQTYQDSQYDLVLYFVSKTGLLQSLKNTASKYAPKIYFCLIDDFLFSPLSSTWVNHVDSFKTLNFKQGGCDE